VVSIATVAIRLDTHEQRISGLISNNVLLTGQ